MDPAHEVGDKWLTEAERRDKSSRDEEWRVRQHKIRFQQANDFERPNDALNPVWPLDVEDVPSTASVSDDDSSVDSMLGFDDASVDSSSTRDNAPEGASLLHKPPPSKKTPHKLPPCRSVRQRELQDRQRELQRETLPPPPPRRSKRLRGEAKAASLASHPDY